MSKSTPVTHWLQSPNKNYLGHQDFAEGQEMILTIKSVALEEVQNPVKKQTKKEKVIRFEEDCKPFICNQINSKTIMKNLGVANPAKCIGKKIKLYVTRFNEETDCIRIRNVSHEELSGKTITAEEAVELEKLLEKSLKDKIEFCVSLDIESISQLPASKLSKVTSRLQEIITAAEKKK